MLSIPISRDSGTSLPIIVSQSLDLLILECISHSGFQNQISVSSKISPYCCASGYRWLATQGGGKRYEATPKETWRLEDYGVEWYGREYGVSRIADDENVV